MKNYEYYKEDIEKVLEQDSDIAIVDGKPVPCGDMSSCKDCERSFSHISDYTCDDEGLIKWLFDKHEEESKNGMHGE